MKKVLAWIHSKLSGAGATAVTDIIESAAESKLVAVLQDLHDSNEDDYKATLQAGMAFIGHLKPAAAKTPTTIDDAILQDLENIINESATQNKYVL